MTVQDFIDCLTELPAQLKLLVPSATEEQRNDLRGLLRASTDLLNQVDGLANSGLSWSTVEDSNVLVGHRAGLSIDDLAKKHSRSSGAIRSRLHKLIGYTDEHNRIPDNPKPKFKPPGKTPAELIAGCESAGQAVSRQVNILKQPEIVPAQKPCLYRSSFNRLRRDSK